MLGHMRRLALAGIVATFPIAVYCQSDAQSFIRQDCISCHNQNAKTAGLVLEGLDPNTPSSRADIWEKVIKKVRSGDMPPAGMPRPDSQVAEAFTQALIRELDAAAEKTSYLGRPTIRRLNRTEYTNAVRDLLALDLPLSSDLPQDGLAAGFDNIGDALSISPLLLERYLKLARRITDLAIGTGDSSPVTITYRASKTQGAWQDDMPFGTRGGIAVTHYFPRDGEYRLRAFLDSENGAVTPTEGVRFFQTSVRVHAGSHTFIATFPDNFSEHEGPVPNGGGAGGSPLGGPVDALGSAIRPVIDFLLDGARVRQFEIRGPNAGEAAQYTPGPPLLEKVEISGPYNPAAVAKTNSRQPIFVCKPDLAAQESSCANKIIGTLARRAYRRDVSSKDLTSYLRAYQSARAKSSFEESIAAAVRRILVAPEFLFRLEIDPVGAAPGSIHPLKDFELASRLSFFLWSSSPDDELLDIAHRGKLQDPVVLNAQVLRMLSDKRSDSLVDNFAAQWLGLKAIVESHPDAMAYPDYDSALGDAFQQETHLLLRSVIRDNRSVLDLVDSDYAFVNERLARLYGIPGVVGPGFRRVSLVGHEQRGGLLGEGGILMMTSHTNKTSPVLRGNWILTNLLNSPPPPPPPGVPPLDERPADGKSLTTRQLVERHRASAACSSCHARIDPLGFALENFDVIGRWRTSDGGGAIDASGKLPSGEAFSGPQGLRKLLKSHSDEFAGAAVGKLLTYALGRQLDARDQPTIRKILRQTAPNGYRFLDLVIAVVESVPFRMRQVQEHS
jgi:hypothetical protein